MQRQRVRLLQEHPLHQEQNRMDLKRTSTMNLGELLGLQTWKLWRKELAPCFNLLPLNPQLSSLRSSYCLKFLTAFMSLGLDLGTPILRLTISIFLQQTVEKRQFTESEETSAQLEDFLHSPRKPSLLLTPRHGVPCPLSWMFSSSSCADLDIIWTGCLFLSSFCWRLTQSTSDSSGKHSAEPLTTKYVRKITKRLFILNYWLSCREENFMSSVKPAASAVRFPLQWTLKCFCLRWNWFYYYLPPHQVTLFFTELYCWQSSLPSLVLTHSTPLHT